MGVKGGASLPSSPSSGEWDRHYFKIRPFFLWKYLNNNRYYALSIQWSFSSSPTAEWDRHYCTMSMLFSSVNTWTIIVIPLFQFNGLSLLLLPWQNGIAILSRLGALDPFTSESTAIWFIFVIILFQDNASLPPPSLGKTGGPFYFWIVNNPPPSASCKRLCWSFCWSLPGKS